MDTASVTDWPSGEKIVVEWTLEKCRFGWHGSPYMWMFSINTDSTINVLSFPCDILITLSLVYCKNTDVTQMMYKIRVHQLDVLGEASGQ